MQARRRVSVQRQPKSWSIGLFFGAIMWVVGDDLWSVGSNIWFVLGCCVFSFLMDIVCTGKTSREGVYID